jgi:hypothetical protein
LRTQGLAPEVRAVQFQKVERIEEGLGLVPAMAKQLESRYALLIATNDFTVDQAGAHLEVVHSLDHEGKPIGPAVASPNQQADAHWVAARHQTVAVVPDLMNPVRAGRRTVGR